MPNYRDALRIKYHSYDDRLQRSEWSPYLEARILPYGNSSTNKEWRNQIGKQFSAIIQWLIAGLIEGLMYCACMYYAHPDFFNLIEKAQFDELTRLRSAPRD